MKHIRSRSRDGEVTTYVQEGHRISEIGNKENPLSSKDLAKMSDESVSLEEIDETGQVIKDARNDVENLIPELLDSFER